MNRFLQEQKTDDFRLLESSLDMDIGDLADASFNLLRVQEWFDAILILDYSSASDRLRFRLTNLCKSSFSTSNPSESFELQQDRQHSRLKSGYSVWNRLMTVQVSNSLLQNEVSANMTNEDHFLKQDGQREKGSK